MERPNPDQLLRQIEQSEAQSTRARLKVFLGASAGVGKTYAMLSEAHEQRERGVDIVIGVVETHGRPETEQVLAGLPQLDQARIEYKGVTLKEFDLDAALRRKPEWVIVDELAHTNVPGSRHLKRWQDVMELLAAGISVYTAINIQHIESLNDVVAKITGVLVRETVPDAVLERADDVELIDIPPEALRQRLREGKIYVPERIDAALEGFFKKGNLLALRELSLRKAAERVEAETRVYREGSGSVWATRERILACVAPNKLGERVVRETARLGSAAHAETFALFVESDRQVSRSAEDQIRAEEALRMAERLGLETARRSGPDIVAEILEFARSRNVTLIVVGKPIKSRWQEIAQGSVVDELIRRSGDINVHLITGDPPEPRVRKPQAPEAVRPKEIALAVLGTLAATIVCGFLDPPILQKNFDQPLPQENLIAVYLLAIAFVASRSGTIGAVTCCLLSVASYDFFFIPPRFAFTVTDARYLPTFVIMFVVALLISSLSLRMRMQADTASARERRTAALYDLSKHLSRSRNRKDIAEVTTRKLKDELNVDAAVLLPNERDQLDAVAKSRSTFEKDRREFSVAQWSFDNGQMAGANTDTLPGAVGTYFPLVGDRGVLGVLAVKSMYHEESVELSQHPMLQTFANSAALALERAVLSKENQAARLTAESERIRSSLLSSVSHDIRTPLTSITGAASALMAHAGDPDVLSKSIYDEALRLNRQIRNLLDMTRLDSGAVKPKLEWENLEELVGTALQRADSPLAGREVSVEIPQDFPLVRVDGMLFVQALVNLLENAARHTPAGTPIDVVADRTDRLFRTMVMDRGPGVPEETKAHLFEKFNQERTDNEGFGLGLAIASAAMRVHGGTTSMTDRPGGGSIFTLQVPIDEAPPSVPIS